MIASKYKPIGIGWVVAANIVSLVWPEPAESAEEAKDNAAIVYQNAFELVDELSEEEKKLASTYPYKVHTELDEGITPGLKTRLDQIVEQLHQASSLSQCDWGLPIGEDVNMRMPHLENAISAARLARFHSALRQTTDPKGFINDQFAILKLARNVANEGLIRGANTGLAIEAMVYDSFAKCLLELPAEDQRHLALELSKIPEIDYVKKAVIAEKANGVDLIVKSIRELGVEGSIEDQESSFAGELRLAGVTRIGETSLSIGLEEKDSGHGFVLRLGEKESGVRLVSVDFDREEAVLVKNGEMALVKLHSREIVPLTLQLSKKALSSFMGEQGMREVSSHQDVAEHWLRMIGETSDDFETLINSLDFSRSEYAEWDQKIEDTINSTNVFTDRIVPSVRNTISIEAAIYAQRQMLEAALDVMLEGATSVQRHEDPFGDGPFIYKETENGFRLESQLMRRGEPVKLDVGRPKSTLDGTQQLSREVRWIAGWKADALR